MPVQKNCLYEKYSQWVIRGIKDKNPPKQQRLYGAQWGEEQESEAVGHPPPPTVERSQSQYDLKVLLGCWPVVESPPPIPLGWCFGLVKVCSRGLGRYRSGETEDKAPTT
jgi:hypothetical protein